MAIDQAELRRVGRYEIVREIGRGATAVLYLARQSDLDRLVALKELVGQNVVDPAFAERFVRESRLAASLNHPNVVTVHELFQHEGTAYIAMEYLERGSLRPLVGTLTLAQVAGVLEGLLAGLAHAHSRGVVHRDLKPENVLVSAGGSVKIADFGVAKTLASGGERLTLSGTTVGTPAYMAPEQALAAPAGPAADLYAVGAIAYELLAGDVPFRGDVALAVLLQHVHEPVPSASSARPDVDPALSRWVERMLAKDPEARPRDAVAAWDELEEIVVGLLGPRWARRSRLTESGSQPAEMSATEVTRQVARTAAPRRRRAWVVGLTSALAIVALAGGIGAAVALSSGDGEAGESLPSTASRSTVDESPAPRPAAGATVGGVRFAGQGDDLVATLRASGKPLAPNTVLRRDSDLADGRAWFELRGAGITATTRGASNGELVVRVRKGPSRIRVDVSAEPGAFSDIRARRVDGRTVLLTAIRTEAVQTPSSSPPVSVPPPRNEQPSTTPSTTTPEEPEKPRIKTG